MASKSKIHYPWRMDMDDKGRSIPLCNWATLTSRITLKKDRVTCVNCQNMLKKKK